MCKGHLGVLGLTRAALRRRGKVAVGGQLRAEPAGPECRAAFPFARLW